MTMLRFKGLYAVLLILSSIFIFPKTSLAWQDTTSSFTQEGEQDRVKQFLPTPLVIIDAGHGGLDSGAESHGIKEKDINLNVSKKLYLLLQSQNITAILNRTDDYALSEDNRWHHVRSRHLRDLSQRSALSKQLNHAIFVSIHCNASPSSQARGPLVIHQKTGESYLLASLVQDRLNTLYDANKKPVAAKSFYLLKYINKPSVIVELGFISNYSDRTFMVDSLKQTELAQALASAISHYFVINN